MFVGLYFAEVLTPADEENHINKHKFTVPFVCGCRNLGEALRRVSEGAAMLRTKGEAGLLLLLPSLFCLPIVLSQTLGTGNVVEAVRHARAVQRELRRLQTMDEDEVYSFAKELQVSVDLLKETKRLGKLPVVNFAAGGIATPSGPPLLLSFFIIN